MTSLFVEVGRDNWRLASNVHTPVTTAQMDTINQFADDVEDMGAADVSFNRAGVAQVTQLVVWLTNGEVVLVDENGQCGKW